LARQHIVRGDCVLRLLYSEDNGIQVILHPRHRTLRAPHSHSTALPDHRTPRPSYLRHHTLIASHPRHRTYATALSEHRTYATTLS